MKEDKCDNFTECTPLPINNLQLISDEELVDRVWKQIRYKMHKQEPVSILMGLLAHRLAEALKDNDRMLSKFNDEHVAHGLLQVKHEDLKEQNTELHIKVKDYENLEKEVKRLEGKSLQCPVCDEMNSLSAKKCVNKKCNTVFE